MERGMALAALAAGPRLGRLLSGPGPGLRAGRGHRTAAGRSPSSREADAPVFQYVGERAARADRIFVWGFSFSGALGVPTFVLPSAGPKPRAGSRPPRRIQPVPYRLELDQKVRAAALSLRSALWPPPLLPEALGGELGLWVVQRRGGRPSAGCRPRWVGEGVRVSRLTSGRNVPLLCRTSVIRTSPPEQGVVTGVTVTFLGVAEYTFSNFSPFKCIETPFYRLAWGLRWTVFHVCWKGRSVLPWSGVGGGT